MEQSEKLALIEIFMEKAAIKHHEDRVMAEVVPFLEEQARRKKQDDHEKREKRETDEREHLEQLVLATPTQIDTFSDRLDVFDAAEVQALMNNGRALDEARHARETMEASAYQLPEGRSVFKSEDGIHVFDRNGVALSHETADPNAIPDTAPRWEVFKKSADNEHRLVEDRQQLHQFQHRLDDARETLRKGNVTTDALSKMDEMLRRDQPEAVKALMPGARAGQDAPRPQDVMAADIYRLPASVAPVLAGP